MYHPYWTQSALATAMIPKGLTDDGDICTCFVVIFSQYYQYKEMENTMMCAESFKTGHKSQLTSRAYMYDHICLY